jgi:hypothetical protein
VVFIKQANAREDVMGQGILLLLSGVPLPVVLVPALLWH